MVSRVKTESPVREGCTGPWVNTKVPVLEASCRALRELAFIARNARVLRAVCNDLSHQLMLISMSPVHELRRRRDGKAKHAD